MSARIYFHPNDEAEQAINEFMDEFYKNTSFRISRSDAVNNLVAMGVAARKANREDLAALEAVHIQRRNRRRSSYRSSKSKSAGSVACGVNLFKSIP